MKKENVALSSAVVAAIGASLCCTVPIVFALLGLGAFGAASIFATLRPYLLGVAVLALAFGFYRAYFKREACTSGEACAIKPMSKINLVVLWVSLFAVLAFALAPYYVGYIAATIVTNKQPAPMAQPATTQKSQFETVTIEVEGMDCESCEIPIKAALDKTQGVRSAEVSFKQGKARVEYDAKQTDITKIKRAIDRAGFKAK
jgi:copper chaperone CopZ